MLKNTKELYVLVAALIVGTARSLKDGKFGFNDIGNYIQAFLTGEPAIDGIGEIPSELGNADSAEKNEAADEFYDSIVNDIDDEDAADAAAILGGIQASVALTARKTKKETLTKVAAALNAPHAVADGGWTADALAELIE